MLQPQAVTGRNQNRSLTSNSEIDNNKYWKMLLPKANANVENTETPIAGWWKDTWKGMVSNRRLLRFSSIQLLCGMFRSVSHCDKWIFKLQLGTNQTSKHWRTSQFSVSVRSLTSGIEEESSVSFNRKLPQEKLHSWTATTLLEGKVRNGPVWLWWLGTCTAVSAHRDQSIHLQQVGETWNLLNITGTNALCSQLGF